MRPHASCEVPRRPVAAIPGRLQLLPLLVVLSASLRLLPQSLAVVSQRRVWTPSRSAVSFGLSV